MEWRHVQSKLEVLITDTGKRGTIKAALLEVGLEKAVDFFEGTDEEIVSTLHALVDSSSTGSPTISADDALDALLPPSPSGPLPSPAGYTVYLADVTGMRVPVAPVFHSKLCVTPVLIDKLVCVSSEDVAPYQLGDLIFTEPFDFHTEMTTSVYLGHTFMKVFKILGGVMTLWDRLSFTLSLNSTERDTTSRAVPKGLRPDTQIVVRQSTLLIGEDKKETLRQAELDLEKKLKGGFSRMHYGGVDYLLAYAAAGCVVQFHVVSSTGEVSAVTERVDFSTAAGRVKLVLLLAKLYRLLLDMSAKLPEPGDRLPLFVAIARGSNCTLLLNNTGCCKEILSFKLHEQLNHTSFSAVQQAYKVAADAAASCRSRGELPFLVQAAVGPTLSEEGIYNVTATPLGYVSEPTNDEEIVQAGIALCCTAQVLHAAGLVYRNFKRQNLLRLDPSRYIVVGMERVATVPSLLPAEFTLPEWDADTTETLPVPGRTRARARQQPQQQQSIRRYTTLSDMRQIGKLLSQFAANLQPAMQVKDSVQSIINQLTNKQLDAAAAVKLFRREAAP